MILVLMAGLLGFAAALVGVLGFGLSPVVALALWAGSGPLAGAALLVATLLRGEARPGRALGLPRAA